MIIDGLLVDQIEGSQSTGEDHLDDADSCCKQLLFPSSPTAHRFPPAFKGAPLTLIVTLIVTSSLKGQSNYYN